MKSMLKKFLSIIVIFVFPLVSLVLLGVIYVITRMIGGMEPLAAIHSFKALIYSLMPYFPHLTIIPIVLISSILLLKHWGKIKKWTNIN